MPTYATMSLLNQCFDDSNNTIAVAIPGTVDMTATVPQAYGTDATGADAYATILTASADATHIYIHNSGTHPAIISVDGGTTDHFFIPGSHAATFDNVSIPDTTVIQAKNGTPGSNYTGLYITIW